MTRPPNRSTFLDREKTRPKQDMWNLIYWLKNTMWIAIFKEDERYRDSPWTIVKHLDIEILKFVLFLRFFLGQRADIDAEGNYDSLLPKVDHKMISNNDINIFNRGSNLLERGNVTVLIWNVRSLNNYTKKYFLTSLLHSKAIDLAII